MSEQEKQEQTSAEKPAELSVEELANAAGGSGSTVWTGTIRLDSVAASPDPAKPK